MNFNVYLIIAKRLSRYITYVGYAKDLKKRLLLHNKSKGAKFTRGNKWKLVYKKTYSSKTQAMREEYKLKKNYKYRSRLKRNYIIKYENSNTTSL